MTISEVVGSGFDIVGEVRVDLFPTDGATMAKAISTQLAEFTTLMSVCRPNIVLLLGDRGEMLAGAVAALHLNIVVGHIHGGERSGTIDESVRHAISKLSHIHFVATAESADRLAKMGERPESIFQTGAPGLDSIESCASLTLADLWHEFGLVAGRPVAILLYHPVVQEAHLGGKHMEEIVLAFADLPDWQVVAIMPNTDAGGTLVADVLSRASSDRFRLYSHMTRAQFLSFLRHASVLIGNSSSGIIEAASFGVPVINVGSRQNLRERNANVIDVQADKDEIKAALTRALIFGHSEPANVYGDGHASGRIRDLLKSISIDERLMNKVLTY